MKNTYSIRKAAAALLTLAMAFGTTACSSPAEPAAEETSPDVTVVPAIKEILLLVPDEVLNVNGQALSYTVISDTDVGDGEAYLNYGDMTAALGYTEWACNSYVAVLDESRFIVYATLGFSNDWYETRPVVCSSGTLTACPSVEGCVASPADITAEDRCLLQSRASVFGTYGTITAYNLTDNGLTPESSYVQIINNKQVEDGSFLNGLSEDNASRTIYDAYGRRTLTLKSDLLLHTDRGETALAAGTVVRPTGFDSSTGQFFVQYESGEGWFAYAAGSKGRGYAIDGLDEEDCFETLAYAG